MANEVFKGLFGFSPDELIRQREAENEVRAFQMAQLTPMQQLSFQGFQGANQVQQGLTTLGQKLFNIEDPQMKEAALMDSVFKDVSQSGVDPTSTQGLQQIASRLTQAGASPRALERVYAAYQQAQQNEAAMGLKAAQTSKATAEATRIQEEAAREQAMRDELASLPADATPEQRYAVVAKYASPDKQLAGIDYQARLKAEREARIEQANLRHEQRMEELRQQGANRADLERERRSFQLDLERIRQEGKREAADAKKYDGFVKAERAAESLIDNASVVTRRLESVKARINNKTAGLAGAALSKIWSTEAEAIALELDSIGANIAFDKLSEMRSNSPTGGALGNVSNYEGQQLRDSVAALKNTQNPAQLRKNIDQVIERYNSIVSKTQKYLEQDRSKFRKGEQPSKTITVDY